MFNLHIYMLGMVVLNHTYTQQKYRLFEIIKKSIDQWLPSNLMMFKIEHVSFVIMK